MTLACDTTPHLRLALHAMGTRFELLLPGGEPLRPAGEQALADIARLHHRYSAFDPASFLAHLNRHAARTPVPLDEETFGLLAACEAAWRDSAGAFDPTIAPLLARFGLRDADPDAPWGFRHVHLDHDARTVTFDTPGLALDLGSIAKGFALDLAGRTLREAGVSSALLHGGTSTILAIGAPPDRDAWSIRLGRCDGAPTVALRDAALSVSAPHGRTATIEGVTHGHVMDPRTGTPASAHTLAAVLHPSARDSDAWSTALLVVGTLPPHTVPAAWLADADPQGPTRWTRFDAAREFEESSP